MKTLLALIAAGSLVTLFGSCERHSWDDSTKRLFEEHHTGGGEHVDHKGEKHVEE